MKIYFKLTLVLGILICFMSSFESVFASDRDDDNIRMAEHAIMATLVVQSSQNGRYLCSRDKMACLGSNQADMGLAIIGGKNDDKHIARLADLVRYQMDGGFAEEYTCYVLERGSKLNKHFEKIDFKRLEDKCLSEFKAFTKNKAYLGAVDYKQVCRDSASIKIEIDKLLGGIARKNKCID